MGSERERTRVYERLQALADATLEPDEACFEAIDVLRRVVGFERWCWPRTDPGSALSTMGVAEFDLWPEVPRIAALEEHGDIARKPRLVVGPRSSVSLSAETGGDLARSRRWSDCLQPYGVGDELMTVCCDRHGCWGSVELMRNAGDPAFGQDDADLLDRLAPLLAQLMRRSQRRDGRVQPSNTETLAPATLILDRALQPASWTPALRDWLAELTPDAMLPIAVYELGARVLTPRAETTGLPPIVRIRTLTGRWATLEGALLEGASEGDVVITFREASVEEVFDLLCRTHDLTGRERQLAALVLDGLATKQIAQALCISPYTVQDHFKAIFVKTGARNRRELISHLAGRAPAS